MRSGLRRAVVHSDFCCLRSAAIVNPPPSLSSPACRASVHAASQLAIPDTVQILYVTAAGAQHDMVGHAECAARIPAILEALDTHQLTPGFRPDEVLQLEPTRLATFEEVSAVHDGNYVKGLEKIMQQSALQEGPAIVESAPTYVTTTSNDAALRSAGAALDLIDAVVAAAERRACSAGAGTSGGSVPVGFSICRPPGHHAVRSGPMGFCLLSTMAIAARYCQQHHGLRKVMIFDFDVHHGNGTHDIFYDDPSVLFVSTHQSGSYPGTGRLSEVGSGEGEGASINLPLPGDSGDAVMQDTFERVIGPAAARFQPDIILVSAGYDAHWRDPLAGLQLRTSTYHRLSSLIKQLASEHAGGRCVFLLEGGYDLKALGEAVADTFQGLLGAGSIDKFNPDLLRDEPRDKANRMLQDAVAMHSL